MTKLIIFQKNELIIPLYFVITNHLEFIKLHSKKQTKYRIFSSSIKLLPKYIKQIFLNLIDFVHEFSIILPNQDITITIENENKDKNKKTVIVGLFDKNFENFTEIKKSIVKKIVFT
jgi:hypothetical protein